MFLQIHTLTSYHGSLLNRDDAGLAKRIPFGDATRLRISSQCLKRHWREALRQNLKLPSGIRSRHFFSREVLPRVIANGINEENAHKLIRGMIEILIAGGLDDGDTLFLKQPILFGKPEADFLVALVSECTKQDNPEKALEDRLKSDKKNFRAMLSQAGHGDLFAGFEGALFGRFVTSDILARSDASVHVAHALTVHALDTEVDYFTVVDDLLLEEETGAAHAGDMELGAGLFYGYVAVDTPLLVSNLTGCNYKDWKKQQFDDARDVLRALIRAIATVSPGAKLGSTAPHAYSEFVLLESGTQQPRSLANAFLAALQPKGDLMQTSVDALANHVLALDSMYGKTADTRVASSTHSVPPDCCRTMPLEKSIDQAIEALVAG